MNRWHLLAAALVLLPGLAGLTGSSWGMVTRSDLLLEEAERPAWPEAAFASRLLRSDEWSVDLPLSRAQQLATPAFPLVSAATGLGQVQRGPASAPVADWGLLFRPTAWPLLLGTPWSQGLRWFLRDALLLLGLFGWFGAVVRASGAAGREGGGDAERAGREARAADRAVAWISALAAFAVFASSLLRWWLSTPFCEGVAFAGLAVAAADARARASGPPRHAWLAAIAWAGACAFFAFYPPAWAPLLWVLCAGFLDLSRRRAHASGHAEPGRSGSPWARACKLAATAREAAAPIAAAGAGVALSIAYHAPWLALVAGTVYPGRRIAEAGTVGWDRLLAHLWPSLEAASPAGGAAVYLGAGEGPAANVCEVSVVEVLPLLPLVALVLADRRVRRLARETIGERPFTVGAWAVLAAWLWLPLPRVFGWVTLLRFTPGPRALLGFGLATALLAASVLARLAAAPPEEMPRPLGRVVAAVALVAGLAAAVGPARRAAEAGLLAGWAIPVFLAVGLGLAGLAIIGRGGRGGAGSAGGPAGPVGAGGVGGAGGGGERGSVGSAGPRRGALLLAAAWALPVALANATVNPLLATGDLFLRGAGHRAVDDALAARPGRLVDLAGAPGAVLSAFGWPQLGGVHLAPDRDLMAFIAPESPGLVPDVYDRYAHVHFVLPLGPAVVRPGGDAILVPISPCSRRLAALGVNHALVEPGFPPGACGSAFEVFPAGQLALWSRREPVGAVGWSPDPAAASALALDWSAAGPGAVARVAAGRDGFVLSLPAGAAGTFAVPVNLSLVEVVACEHATARRLEAHVAVTPAGAGPSRCEVRWMGTIGGLRRWAGGPAWRGTPP